MRAINSRSGERREGTAGRGQQGRGSHSHLSHSHLSHSHFDVGVGVAIGVHGGQVGAAHDAHLQPLLLRAVLERDEDPATLLQRLVFCFIYLGRECAQSGGCTRIQPQPDTSPAKG